MLMKELNAQIGGAELNTEMVYQTAVNWMELADTDKNGVLGFDEFIEFFQYLDNIVVSDEELEHIFVDLDENGNGSLSLDEFAKALLRTILTEDYQDEPSSGDLEEEDEHDLGYQD